MLKTLDHKELTSTAMPLLPSMFFCFVSEAFFCFLLETWRWIILLLIFMGIFLLRDRIVLFLFAVKIEVFRNFIKELREENPVSYSPQHRRLLRIRNGLLKTINVYCKKLENNKNRILLSYSNLLLAFPGLIELIGYADLLPSTNSITD